MPPVENHVAWLRPTAAAAGLLLLWLLEGWRRLPERRAGASRLRHAVRNLTLGSTGGMLLAVTVAGTTATALEWSSAGRFGLLHTLPLPAPLRLVTAILLMDFWSWGWHLACHKVPFLWRFHRVHHSDPAMDVTTAFRFHPGELLFSGVVRLPVLLLFGLSAAELLTYETLLLGSSQFHHAALRAGWWDRKLRIVLVTPAVHRIHHARERELTNSNYASLLTWWDRLLGTWRDPVEDGIGGTTVPSCGLDGMDGDEWQTLKGLGLSPVRQVRESEN